MGVTDKTPTDGGLPVAQMAEKTGVSAHTLRYYERAGLIHPIERTSGNQRRYRADDIEWVRFLLRLRETGMSIAQMREYARLRAAGDTTLESRMEILLQHDEDVALRIRQLQDSRRALHEKIAVYRRQIEARARDEG
jgi:DNA-binding transcriptional MerR regulator